MGEIHPVFFIRAGERDTFQEQTHLRHQGGNTFWNQYRSPTVPAPRSKQQVEGGIGLESGTVERSD